MRFATSHTPLSHEAASVLNGFACLLALLVVVANFAMNPMGRYGTVALLLLYVVISQSIVVSKLVSGYYLATHTFPMSPVAAGINLLVAYVFLGRPYAMLLAERRKGQAGNTDLYSVK